MAHYDDFDGVYFTVQSLRLHHPEVINDIEVAVIDNNPTSGHANAVKNLLNWIKDIPAYYIPYTEVGGTSAPRNHLFTVGTAPAVMCIDPHILFTPGSIKRLIDWYDGHPDTKDLYQGPMIYDDLKNYATHFDDRWDAEMWGKWNTAFYAELEKVTTPFYEMPPVVEMRDGKTFTLPDYRETNRKAIRPAGENADDPPFEIPSMGLGCFTSRRDAWLGFNKDFRGFGGEEWYIHVKYRQAGHKTICLPFLRWLHRFGRPNGVKYNLQAWDKCRNYVIGHKELNLDLQPVYDHFVKTGKISEDNWKALLDGATQPVSTSGCGCNKPPTAISLEDAYNKAANTPSDINEHVPTLKELASKCDHVTEFGVRTGVSTTGLLAAQPKRLVSYDLNDSPQARALTNVKGKTEFDFIIGDSHNVDIEETDMLFIDTKHTGEHVYGELTRHHAKVKKWIAFHDTEIFGEKGEDGSPGLLHGLRRFLKENPEWSVIRHDANNHGFTVISRLAEDKPELPSGIKQAWNFAKAMSKHVANGLKVLTEEKVQARLDHCWICPLRKDTRCTKCGCFLEERPDGGPGKALLPKESCPLGHWHAEE